MDDTVREMRKKKEGYGCNVERVGCAPTRGRMRVHGQASIRLPSMRLL